MIQVIKLLKKRKKKYLDNLLSKEFINNYFSKKSNIKN